MIRNLGLALSMVYLSFSPLAQAESVDLWRHLAKGHQIVLLRHAIAPGFSDPAHFQLDDCATQRNLSEAGRQQARNIGVVFRQHDLKIEKIYSSQWCRCRETAELLGLGPVDALPILNSFFEQRQREQEQTEALKSFILTTSQAGIILLVTHQVNIVALTGIVPASGEAVVVEVREANMHILCKLPFAERSNQ